MVGAEHIQSERCWDHNQHERLTIVQGVEEDQAIQVDCSTVVTEEWAVAAID